MSTSGARQEKVVRIVDILPPERQASRSARRPCPRRDADDAEFVTLGASLRGRHGFQNDNSKAMPLPTVAHNPIRDGIVGAVNRLERVLMRLSADMFSAVLAAIFVAVFGLAGGFSLFRGAAEADAGPALDITHVSLTPQDANGMRVLLINGIVENRGEERLEMPSIRAELMTDEKVLTSTLIGAPVVAIEGGRSHGFSARVPHPGGKLPDLRLSFAAQGA
ncbi:hypothetical protein [Rhizobium sp. LCM 4573]|uniref:hypothetical protein n=1 Tax=Rhizobium sp. LCM 4573 TaxID=1848291 RepID=UPI0008DA9824|nr:hypothetical protein [Rhizobium sp. LCM 4573]OHV82048.1 hypothetical protein LCM4573_18785 [Rhizobium sp. LCM 4573]